MVSGLRGLGAFTIDDTNKWLQEKMMDVDTTKIMRTKYGGGDPIRIRSIWRELSHLGFWCTNHTDNSNWIRVLTVLEEGDQCAWSPV